MPLWRRPGHHTTAAWLWVQRDWSAELISGTWLAGNPLHHYRLHEIDSRQTIQSLNSKHQDLILYTLPNEEPDRRRQVVPKRRDTTVKSSCTSIGLDPRDWQTIIIVWSLWTTMNRCGKHGVKINSLFFMQGFVGRQIDLKKYSKLHWQPMKGTKQWNTASKWRRHCHKAGQLILYTEA